MSLPPLHLAAQLGNLDTLQALLAQPPPAPNVNDRDHQNITSLHWAAINNHLLPSKYLLQQGALVDPRGGDLDATPLHWAARYVHPPPTHSLTRLRNGHLYIVHLLIKYGADPNLLDSQSFNTLHLAVHSSSALLLAYMLFTHQPVAVDSTDTEGHTALHWACYQGDAISVNLLLRAGADCRKPDAAGLTPLHWAAVKGNSPCIKRLMEAGAEVGAREKLGKTAKEMATELKSLTAYQRGLEEAGFDQTGRRSIGAFSPRVTIIGIFIVPTFFFFLILNTLSFLPWWSGLLLSAAEFFAMHHVVAKFLLNVTDQNSDRLTKSPYLCSIICASIFWVLYIYFTRFIFRSSPPSLLNSYV